MNTKKHIHFIGINGSGISGVACIAKNKGFEVSGCDLGEKGDYTKQLLENNIKISVPHDASHLEGADLVVVSPAILYKDKYKTIDETRIAMEQNKLIKWQKFLGEYVMNRGDIVAVSGTHGKTTTTTMVALLLEKAKFDPTVVVGGVVKEWGQTYRVGNSDFYICEADEFDGNFLNYFPRYLIINNLEMEHPERFNNFEEYVDNFRSLLHTVQENGKILFNYDDQNIIDLLDSVYDELMAKNIELIAYTFKNAKDTKRKVKIVNVKDNDGSIVVDDLVINHHLLGEHNARDIAMASVLARELGIDGKTIQDMFEEFTGTKRRMDLVFSNDRVKLYDDYAHHHTQVQFNLEALKKKLKNSEKIVAVLEPHLISRIKDNTQEYKDALMISDYPIITKIFKSREAFMDDIDVVKLINDDRISYIEDHEDVAQHVRDIVKSSNDKYSVVVMGAGNSYKLTNRIKEIFESEL